MLIQGCTTIQIQLLKAYQAADGSTRALLVKLRQPTGVWILNDLSWMGNLLDNASGERVVLVAYNINDRDCSSSFCGRCNGCQRLSSLGIRVFKIVGEETNSHTEPDALPDAYECPNTEERLASLRFFVGELKRKTNASVILMRETQPEKRTDIAAIDGGGNRRR